MQNNKPVAPATTVLLLPGLMCDAAFWQPLSTDTACPTLRFEVVDYGDADTLEAMALAALLLAPADFCLVGHSMGGRVALEIMRMAPSRVKKLVLMDTGYLPCAQGEPGQAEKAGRMRLIGIAKKEGVRAMCMQWVKAMVHPDRLNDAALIEAITAMFARKSSERFARQQNALLARPDASPVLAALTVPTLLLCGRQDGWASVAQHEAMRALAPHARLGVIENAGHMVLMERPQATVRAITEFLEQSAGLSC